MFHDWCCVSFRHQNVDWEAARPAGTRNLNTNVRKNCGKATLREDDSVFGRQKYTVSRKRPTISTSCTCDSFVVPELKNYLKGIHFPQVRNIGKSATRLLCAFSQNEVSGCCEGWKARVEQCLSSDGSTFKGMTCKYNNLITKVIFETSLVI